ncbi:peptidoglycan-binding domain-containing protein [Spirillospora sp. CA-294931]|uniref:peptidoglycan-binding domain-containing protein n=1 Tax=Spirillospora sp. CA-294931 TaxID=3240042 RepID=UPI003D933212
MFRSVARAALATTTAAALTAALPVPGSASTAPPADERKRILDSMGSKGNRVPVAALPTCNHFTVGQYVRFPSVGSPGPIDCKLEYGNYNNWGVVALQQWLYHCNGAPQVKVDGDYGKVTRDVITWIQAVKGIKADGIYGPDTRAVLSWAKFNGNTFIGCLPPA